MKIKEFFKGDKALFSGFDRDLGLSLIFATVILFVYCYFGTFSFFENAFPNCENVDFWKIIYHNSMSFVLFFGVGGVFVKLIMKKDLKSIGLNLNNKKNTGIIIGFASLVFPLFALSACLWPGMQATYPLIDFSAYSGGMIALYFASYLLYYIGWEFLFRGILFNGTKNGAGVLGAILISTLASALIHTSIAGFGKPAIETLSAIPAGLFFGYVAYKSENIYSSLYCHVLVGFLTDLFLFLI